MHSKESNVCPNCLVGRMRLRLVTYVHVYGRTLVSVPNTPAWECDQCHAREYNRDTVLRIETLVGQAGPPPNRHHTPARQHQSEIRASAHRPQKHNS